jgi:RNA methyltransferase, TrmH family
MSPSQDLLGPKSDAVRGAQLLLEAKHRRTRREFLAEGPQAVNAALDAGWVKYLYVTDDYTGDVELDPQIRTYQVTEQGLAVLAETKSPQGVIAVCRIPEVELDDFKAATRILVASGISDPGNLGTMIRTAAAAGYDLVVTTTGSADVFSGKVIRSTAGMITSIPVLGGVDSTELMRWLTTNSFAVVATAGEADNEVSSQAARDLLNAPHSLWIGNESQGLPSEILKQAVTLRIPMESHVESLNAAVAAAICMYAHKF